MANDPIRSLPLMIMIFKLEHVNYNIRSNVAKNRIIMHTYNVTYNKIMKL